MIIILSGLKTVGKTTIAKYFAKEYNYIFIDLDELMLQNADCSRVKEIGELFKLIGEVEFRNLEFKTVKILEKQLNQIGNTQSDYVIALGGGTLLNPENYKILKNLGIIVYLQAEPALISARIKAMPKIPGLFLTKLNNTNNLDQVLGEYINSRESIYSENADITIHVGNKTIPELSNELHKVTSTFINGEDDAG